MTNSPPVTMEARPQSITLSNGLTRAEFMLDPPSYTLENLESPGVIIDKVQFAFVVEVEDADRHYRRMALGSKDFTCTGHELVDGPVSGGRPGAKTARFQLDAPKARFSAALDIELAPGKSEAIIRASITNNNTFSVRMMSIQPMIAGPGACKALGEGTGDERVFYNGYQSWSASRAFTLKEKRWHAVVKIAEWQYHYLRRGPSWWLSRPRGTQSSNGVAVITQPGNRRSVTIGFVTARSQHGEIEVAGDANRGIQGIRGMCCCDGKPLHPGGEMVSELLYVQDRNQYPRCLDGYSDAIAANMSPVFWSHVPFGYCTWYYYYFNIDEREALKNLEILTDKQKNPYFKVDYFQLDDGYQFTKSQCGDWRRVNPDKFPGGFAKLVEAISGKRIMPGLWVAPFNALPESDLAKEHPDWILKDKKGKPFKPTFISMKYQYALDPTHPGVKAFLKDLFVFLAKEVGFKYIKIDFVFSAITADAVFHDSGVTRVEAYRDALKILREAAGDDVFILGCGAPLLESVGFVNGMRIGTDTAPQWGLLTWILDPANVVVPGMRGALLNTITRSWMHKKLWINDPDCLMVRSTRTKLTEDEIRTELSVIGLSGGQVAVSDDLALLPGDRMRLISLVQPVYPEPAHSPDMFVQPFPELYLLEGKSGIHGDWKVVTVINWSGKKRDLALVLTAIGCAPSMLYHVVDFWNGTYVGAFNGNESVPLPGVAVHGCRLLRVTLDPGQEAALLGTTLHVVQGAIEVEAFAFEREARRVRLKLNKYGRNEGTIFVKMPGRCFFELVSGPGYNVKDVADGVYAVDVSFDHTLDITLKVELA
ncbi:MAG: alpha-galactosidase [Candidatus Lokiarchaeota archaeon]|nr:alpha-galactosidase [Candidatus Lokiarchaeota archaeon]